MSKKFLALMLCISLCVCGSAWAEVTIDETTFPNTNFRRFITDRYDSDDNKQLDDER